MAEALFAHGAVFDGSDEMLVFCLQYASQAIQDIFRDNLKKAKGRQAKEASRPQRRFVFANPELGQQLQAQLETWIDSGVVWCQKK